MSREKKWAVAKILLSLIPFALFTAYAIIQIPICKGYDYPMPMLGVDAMNWFDAWFMTIGMVFVYCFLIFLICLIILILNVRIFLKKK